MSKDLDFITVARNKVIAPVIAELGFQPQGKDFVHADSKYFIEFPPGPLSFGNATLTVQKQQYLRRSTAN